MLQIYFGSGSETFISVPDPDPQHCLSRFTSRPFQDQKRNIFIFRAWLDKRNEYFFREKSTNVEVNSTNVRDNFCIFRQLLEATAYLHSNGKRSNSPVFFLQYQCCVSVLHKLYVGLFSIFKNNCIASISFKKQWVLIVAFVNCTYLRGCRILYLT